MGWFVYVCSVLCWGYFGACCSDLVGVVRSSGSDFLGMSVGDVGVRGLGSYMARGYEVQGFRYYLTGILRDALFLLFVWGGERGTSFRSTLRARVSGFGFGSGSGLSL